MRVLSVPILKQTHWITGGRIIESTNLESDENIISLDVKSLYTNVPLKEALDTAVSKIAAKTTGNGKKDHEKCIK